MRNTSTTPCAFSNCGVPFNGRTCANTSMLAEAALRVCGCLGWGHMVCAWVIALCVCGYVGVFVCFCVFLCVRAVTRCSCQAIFCGVLPKAAPLVAMDSMFMSVCVCVQCGGGAVILFERHDGWVLSTVHTGQRWVCVLLVSGCVQYRTSSASCTWSLDCELAVLVAAPLVIQHNSTVTPPVCCARADNFFGSGPQIASDCGLARAALPTQHRSAEVTLSCAVHWLHCVGATALGRWVREVFAGALECIMQSEYRAASLQCCRLPELPYALSSLGAV